MTPGELYAAAKAAVDRLDASGADPREWARFSGDLLETIMKVQSFVMDRQRVILERTRIDALAPELGPLRREARDALYCLDKLTALYERVKQRLRSPPTAP